MPLPCCCTKSCCTGDVPSRPAFPTGTRSRPWGSVRRHDRGALCEGHRPAKAAETMKTLRLASAYKKDLKRIARRDYDLALLAEVLNALRADRQLPAARRDHPLKGEWKG